MLNREQIQSAVVTALVEHGELLDVKQEEVDSQFLLFSSGALDSIRFVKMLLQVEDLLETSFHLDELDFGNLEKIEDLVGQLDEQTNEKVCE